MVLKKERTLENSFKRETCWLVLLQIWRLGEHRSSDSTLLMIRWSKVVFVPMIRLVVSLRALLWSSDGGVWEGWFPIGADLHRCMILVSGSAVNRDRRDAHDKKCGSCRGQPKRAKDGLNGDRK